MTARRRRWVRIRDGLPSIQFLHDGVEGGVTEPLVVIAREQSHSIRLQYIERVLDFATAAVRIGERYGCKHAKASRKIRSQRGCIFVAVAGQATSLLLIAEPDPARTHGGYRG